MPLYESCGFLGFGKRTVEVENVCKKHYSSETMYNIVGTDKTFKEAKELITPGCTMLSRHDVMQNHSALKQFMSGLSGGAWVDATRTEDGSKFRWNDGTLIEQGTTPWADGEPNNYGNAEGHVEIRTDGNLNDVSGENKYMVVESCNVLIKR